MKEEIIQLILNEYSEAYCHNCDNQEDGAGCDECNRKSIMWSASYESAEELANKIIKLGEK